MGVASPILVAMVTVFYMMVTVFYMMEKVEIGRVHNTILSQKKKYWDFCIQPNRWCTTFVHQMGYPFIFNGGLQIFKYL